MPGEGWHVYDPTPPSGRPSLDQEGGLARQAWDYLLFRWDRYVLTYGLYDQLRIFGDLRNAWHDFWKIFERDKQAEEAPLAPPSQGPTAVPATPGGPRFTLRDVPLPAVFGLLLLAAVLYFLYRRHRPPLTATAAYRRLRRRLGRSGAPVPDSVPPLRLHREAEARYPAAAAPMARVIDFYLRESFGGEPLREEERGALKAALDAAERGFNDKQRRAS